VRGVYTLSKALDDGDSLNQTTAGTRQGGVGIRSSGRRQGTGDVRREKCFVVNVLYDLPFAGTGFARDVEGWRDKV